jgi:hypothetical protein
LNPRYKKWECEQLAVREGGRRRERRKKKRRRRRREVIASPNFLRQYLFSLPLSLSPLLLPK